MTAEEENRKVWMREHEKVLRWGEVIRLECLGSIKGLRGDKHVEMSK